ncbi:MAG: hypothetical protein V4684_09675 [Pseudomonadota bacterium]
MDQHELTPATAKGAELASGLGAIALGAGLALIAPDIFRDIAVPLLMVGIVVHGVGMTLKHQFERSARSSIWWESALFWLCWACLAVVAIWVVVRSLGD